MLAVAVALCSCLALISPVRGEGPDELTRLQIFAIDPFSDPIGHSLVAGDAKGRLIERFGKPTQEETRSRPDRTSDATFAVLVLNYPGLKIVVGESSESGNSWIERIEITGNQHSLKYGLKIGATRSDVIDALQTSKYLKTEDRLHFTAYVWEERTDAASRPGEAVRVEGEIDVLVEFNRSGLVQKISIVNITL